MRGNLVGASGGVIEEAAPWDVTTAAQASSLGGPLKGEALEAWTRHTTKLLEQRTLAKGDLWMLKLYCHSIPGLRRAALAGDDCAARELREFEREWGIIDGDRIEPFRGSRPTLATVLRFKRRRSRRGRAVIDPGGGGP